MDLFNMRIIFTIHESSAFSYHLGKYNHPMAGTQDTE